MTVYKLELYDKIFTRFINRNNGILCHHEVWPSKYIRTTQMPTQNKTASPSFVSVSPEDLVAEAVHSLRKSIFSSVSCTHLLSKGCSVASLWFSLLKLCAEPTAAWHGSGSAIWQLLLRDYWVFPYPPAVPDNLTIVMLFTSYSSMSRSLPRYTS